MSADITELRDLSKLDFIQKKELIARGRSTPDLDGLLQQKGQNVSNRFKQTGMEGKNGCASSQQQLLLLFTVFTV